MNLIWQQIVHNHLWPNDGMYGSQNKLTLWKFMTFVDHSLDHLAKNYSHFKHFVPIIHFSQIFFYSPCFWWRKQPGLDNDDLDGLEGFGDFVHDGLEDVFTAHDNWIHKAHDIGFQFAFFPFLNFKWSLVHSSFVRTVIFRSCTHPSFIHVFYFMRSLWNDL